MGNKKALIVLIVALVVIAAGTVIYLTMGNAKQNEVYTVTFVSDNGAVITTQKVEQGEKAVMPKSPTKEGHIFIGWTYSGLTYDFSSKIESNLTLEAKWQEVKQDVKTFVITFNSDGGTTIENQIVEEHKKVEKPENPEKEGYVFKAWMLNDAEFDFNTEVTANLELKAKWEQVKEDKEENKEENKDKVETITVKAPTLTNAEGGKGWAKLNIVTKGAYAKSTKAIAGYELYEKNGTKYTKLHSSTKDFGAKVTLDLGESKTYVARVYAYDKSNKKVYSAYSNEVKLTNPLETPTLGAGRGSKGFAGLGINIVGYYAQEGAMEQIDGYELYEKNGSKYTKLDSWDVTADVGETRIFVARVYALNKSNKKVYSAYSNEFKLTNIVETPTLGAGRGSKGFAGLGINVVGYYAQEGAMEQIDGYELYEKNGSKYTKLDSWDVTADIGETRTFVARVYAYNKANKKVYSAYSNEFKLTNLVEKPTLSIPAGGPGSAQFTIVYEGFYGYESSWDLIDGWELYEKNGSKYTLVHTSESKYVTNITLDVGESKTYVARVYAYNKSNVKVYSAYSNEVKFENKVEKPTLSIPAGGPGSAQFTIVYEGFYGYESSWDLIDGWELYEKNGSKYTLVHTGESKYVTNITLDVGESKTYVARVYAYNKSNVKVYSAYSNEVKFENKVQTPTLSTPMGGAKGGQLSVVYEGYYANGTELIDGVEIYEKEGNKYTKIYSSESKYYTDITLNEGESKIYVARVYAYNKSNQKMYSAYSNAIVLPHQ